MDVCSYVSELELKPHQSSGQLMPGTKDEAVSATINRKNATTAIINANSICVFGNQVTDQNKQDISNSVLLAYLASDKKNDRFSEPEQWLSSFLNILGSIGWTQPGFSFSKYSPTVVNWIDIVLESMKNVASQDESDLAKTGMGAWKNLQINSQGMNIWSVNSLQNQPIFGNKQIFQIIPVESEGSGNLQIIIGAVYSETKGNPNGFLSWQESYDIHSSSVKASLNEDIYAKVRQMIIEKLGDKPKEFVTNLPIG